MLLAFILCHNATSKYSKNQDKFITETEKSFEKTLLEVAESLDFKFVCANCQSEKVKYILEIENELHDFEVLAINSNHENRNKFSVLVEFPESFT